MKSLTFLLVGIGILSIVGQARAQTNRDDGQKKPLNNPMYSTANYKHPNMAAAASRWEKKTGVAVQKPAPSDAQLANYKNQHPAVQPVGGVSVDHTPTMSLADRNYKIQRVSEPREGSAATEYMVKKRNKKSDSTAVGED